MCFGHGVPLTKLQIVGQVCWGCHRSSEEVGAPLKGCKQCRRAVYCSTGCQKTDWAAEHKKLCKGFQQLNKYDQEHPVVGAQDHIEMAFLIHRLHQEPRERIFYSFSPHGPCGEGKRCVQYQPVCDVCYRTPFQSPQFRELIPCQTCRLAFHCSSEECATRFSTVHGPPWCDMLRDVATCQRALIAFAKARPNNPHNVLVNYSEGKRSTYVRLSSVSGWQEYQTRLWPQWDEFFARLVSEFKSADPRAAFGLAAMFQDGQTRAMTTLAALEATVRDLSTKEKLVVHVVGSAQTEFETAAAFEELLHFLPALRMLVVVHVGPDVDPGLAADNQARQTNWACRLCGPVVRRMYYHTGVYHDFVRTVRYTKNPPDIIVSFNTGLAEVEPASWLPTQKAILDSGVPAAFTAYTQYEAHMEEQVWKVLGAHFVVPASENKWRSGTPLIHGGEREFVAYSNRAWYVVKGRA